MRFSFIASFLSLTIVKVALAFCFLFVALIAWEIAQIRIGEGQYEDAKVIFESLTSKDPRFRDLRLFGTGRHSSDEFGSVLEGCLYDRKARKELVDKFSSLSFVRPCFEPIGPCHRRCALLPSGKKIEER